MGPTLFARAYSLPLKEASSAFGLYFGLAGLSGMLIFGFLSDRLARRGMEWPLRLAALALLSASVFILLVTWSASYTMARWLSVPSGLMGGGWSIGMLASLQYLLPDRFRATATAIFVTVTTFAGFVIGPWATGAISQALGDDAASLRFGLSMVIPTGLIGAILAWRTAKYLDHDREQMAQANQG